MNSESDSRNQEVSSKKIPSAEDVQALLAELDAIDIALSQVGVDPAVEQLTLQ